MPSSLARIRQLTTCLKFWVYIGGWTPVPSWSRVRPGKTNSARETMRSRVPHIISTRRSSQAQQPQFGRASAEHGMKRILYSRWISMQHLGRISASANSFQLWSSPLSFSISGVRQLHPRAIGVRSGKAFRSESYQEVVGLSDSPRRQTPQSRFRMESGGPGFFPLRPRD